jgi:hypothetical protein
MFGVVMACGDDDDDTISADEWTDPATGLTWQVMPPAEYANWNDALAYCDGLILGGHGNWRLPTISELRTLIRGCADTTAGGACGVTDECLYTWCQQDVCYDCDYPDGPNNGCYAPPEVAGECNYYWSSSHVANADDRAWAVGFTSAFIYKPRVYYAFHARCVR